MGLLEGTSYLSMRYESVNIIDKQGKIWYRLTAIVITQLGKTERLAIKNPPFSA